MKVKSPSHQLCFCMCWYQQICLIISNLTYCMSEEGGTNWFRRFLSFLQIPGHIFRRLLLLKKKKSFAMMMEVGQGGDGGSITDVMCYDKAHSSLVLVMLFSLLFSVVGWLPPPFFPLKIRTYMRDPLTVSVRPVRWLVAYLRRRTRTDAVTSHFLSE